MCVVISIKVPETVAKRLRSLGVDIESRVIDILLKQLRLNPDEETRIHIELAKDFLEKGKEFVYRDPTQASEKLYKAVEECIKALTIHFKLGDILKKVRDRGRWTVTDLEKASQIITDKIGAWFYDAWDHAWILHVWGFHEVKLDVEAVKRRLPYIERVVKETEQITSP